MANIHPLATVHPNAKLGENVEVGPYAYIEEHVEEEIEVICMPITFPAIVV